MKLKRIFTIAVIVLAFGIYMSYTLKTPADYLYRICRECGVSDVDVDEILIMFHGASEPRIVLMDLYRDTFDDPS